MRICFLLLFWSITLPLLYYLTSAAGIVVDCCHIETTCFPAPPHTQFGPFATAYYNPDQQRRPDYGIRFETLNVSNRSVGFLRTALHQNVRLEQLHLTLFSYPQDCAQKAADTADNCDLYDDNTPGFAHPLHTISASLLTPSRLRSNPTTQIHFPDISKTTEVSITDFSVDWHIDNQIELTIQSRRAVFAAERPDELQLLGRVILETPNGKLQTNRVIWDIDKHIFHVRGRYHYRTPHTTFSGRDDSLDYRLNVLTNPNLHTQGGPLWSANE